MTDIELPVRFMHEGRELASLRLGSAEDGWTDRTCSLWLSGDILNVRNIQGGQYQRNPDGSVNRGMLNLDFGGGSTENPGHVIVNFDIGLNTEIFDGHKNRIAAFRRGKTEPQNVVRHWGKTYLHRGAYVPAQTDPDGTVTKWRSL